MILNRNRPKYIIRESGRRRRRIFRVSGVNYVLKDMNRLKINGQVHDLNKYKYFGLRMCVLAGCDYGCKSLVEFM
jgi:hypothetical protein